MTVTIFLVGFAIRLSMLLSSKSLWGDEIYSVDWALHNNFRDIVLHCSTVNHPPLYYFIVHLFLRVLGAHEITLRLASFLASVITLWAVYPLGKKLFSKGTAKVAAALVAVSPYFLQSSNEIRPYSVIAMMSALILLFLFKSFKKKRYLIPYVLLSSMITYVEHIGVFVLLAIAVYLFMLKRKDTIICQGVIFLSQIPWAFLVWNQALGNEKILQIDRVQEYWNFPWMLKKGFGIFWHFFCGYQFSMLTVGKVIQHLKTSPLFWSQGILTLVGIVAILASFQRLYAKRKALFWLLSSLCLAPFFFLLFVYPIRLDARYLHFAAPLIFVLMADGLWAWKPKWVSVLFLSWFLAMSVAVDLYAIQLKTDVIHKEDFKSMIAYVSGQVDAGSAVVGSQHHRDYYVKFLHFNAETKYFNGVGQLTLANTEKLDKLWLLKQLNMHPNVSERILSDDENYLKSLGFVENKKIRFGGAEEGLTVACLYVKKDKALLMP